MAAPPAGQTGPETALQKLARRPFTVSLLSSAASPSSTSSATPVHSRHLKRIHLAPEILKAVKICAGDALVIRKMGSQANGLESGMRQLELDEAS